MADATNVLSGFINSQGFKAPCRVATTGNLSGLIGLLVIDGIQLVSGDRVLVWQQTDQTQNGIYKVATGAWARAIDFSDTSAVTRGTQVLVTDGSTYTNVPFELQESDVTFGTTAITFLALTTIHFGNLTITGNLVVDGTVNIAGVTTLNSILVINQGTSSVPAALFSTNLAGAWPSVVLENLSTDDTAQLQLFFRRRDASNVVQIWQLAFDANVNYQLFNIEPVDLVTGVLATPLSLRRTGEVGFGGTPIVGIEATAYGKIRSFNDGGAHLGRYEGGDGTTYIYMDSTTGLMGLYFANTAAFNILSTGIFPAVNGGPQLGSSSFRFNDIYSQAGDFSGAVKLGGTVGFNGTSPIAKPTVTGSRGANAALASLLTALSNYGLLIDSSS